MSYTQAQLQKLKEMYAKGVLTVEQGGEKITFESGEHMRRRIKHIENELARQAGGASATQGVSYPVFSKGLDR